MATVSDNFNRADGALTTNWTDVFGTGNLLIATNQITGGNNQYRESRWSGTALATANYYTQLVYKSSLATSIANLVVRGVGSAGTRSGYMLQINQTGAWRIIRITTGTEVNLGTGGSVTHAADDIWRLEVQGSTLRAKRNSVLLESLTDTNFTAAGAPGVGIFQNNANLMKWDDFSAGDLAATPSTGRSRISHGFGFGFGV